ncbi:MAG TPA: NAD(P)-binding domain-containing protein [Ignavibacteriaceae bacterium]|nr:NAD(P)-binding domain-containing protein [Ignavibacteriaceae bacterium]
MVIKIPNNYSCRYLFCLAAYLKKILVTILNKISQAGLSTSYYLKQSGNEHIILEKAARPADAWRNGRWDSFTLVTPNWSVKIPGAEYNGDNREGFMPRDEVVKYFENYIDRFQLPVRFNQNVLSIEPIDHKGYKIETEKDIYEAKNVVAATGYEQSPKIPESARKVSSNITQLHSSRYKNPASLPDGAVLIVGTGQSGCQIAEELYQSGRKVFLCTGSAGRAPRRYRGKDTVEWLYDLGFFNITPDKLPVPIEHFAPPHVSGSNGGHNLNLHQFSIDGVTLLGHFRSADSDKIYLIPDLYENLTKADQFELNVLKMIDGFIQGSGLNAPAEVIPQMSSGYNQPIIEELNITQEGIKTIIWACGYIFDYSFVKLPVHDKNGFPIQTNGVANYPGLYFVGMPWMPSLKSVMLSGVGEAAKYIAEKVVERTNQHKALYAV